jgi:hypothetical protein
MKKNYLFLSITILLGLLVWSCKNLLTEEVATQNTTTQRLGGTISVKDGRLVFADRTVWETTINQLANTTTDELESLKEFERNNTGYTSLRSVNETNANVSEDYDDELISTLLNAQGIVQINNYIVKVDVANEKVYVVDKEENVNLLNTNPTASQVMVFGTDEDVLEALEYRKIGGIFCSALRADKRREVRKNCYPDDDLPQFGNQVRLRLVYQRWGIYFSLLTQAKAMGSFDIDDANTCLGGGIITCDEVYTDWRARYKVRCKSNEYNNSGREPQRRRRGDCTGNIIKRIYQASSALEKYELVSVFRNLSDPYIAPVARIAWGY